MQLPEFFDAAPRIAVRRQSRSSSTIWSVSSANENITSGFSNTSPAGPAESASKPWMEPSARVTMGW